MKLQLARRSTYPRLPRQAPRLLGRLAGLVAAIAVSATIGCGSGGSDSSNVGGLSALALWQQPDDSIGQLSGSSPGFGSELPAAVRTVRLDFAPDGGAACCVAIDPSQLNVDPSTGRRRVVLTGLPAGPGLLTIAGFPGASAAAPDGATATCELEPASAASPCVAGSLAGPSFLSEPADVTVVAGTQTNAGDILVPAVPFFILDTLQPPPNGNAATPVQLGATVAISGTTLPFDQIAITTTPGGNAAVTLTPCNDLAGTACSTGGSLEVRGLRAAGQSSIAPGNTTVRIVASGGGAAPLSIEYPFTAVGSAPSPTATQVAVATATPVATNPAATRTPAPASPTPTFTVTQTVRFTPTSGSPTATPNAMCGATPATGCLRPLDGTRSTLIVGIDSNPNNDRLSYDWERGNFIDGRDFGDPGLTTSYAICIYDDIDRTTTLVRQLFIPASANCAAGECWNTTDDGFRYSDPSGQIDGIQRIDLVAGQPGRTNILVRGGGRNLEPPALPFDQDPTVIIQIKNDFEEGQCWETYFSSPAERNDASLFRDSGDNAISE